MCDQCDQLATDGRANEIVEEAAARITVYGNFQRFRLEPDHWRSRERGEAPAVARGTHHPHSGESCPVMAWAALSGGDSWWLEHGLDGLVTGLLGAVIGGLATAVAVWLTLRHERSQAREANFEAAIAEFLPVAGRFCARFGDTEGRTEQIDLIAPLNGAEALMRSFALIASRPRCTPCSVPCQTTSVKP